MKGIRQQKVGSLLVRTLSEYFRLEARNFSGALITITDVWTSPDLKTAKFYISIFGESTDKQKVLKEIQDKGATIRGFLGNTLAKQLRHIPELFFLLDESIDKQQEIERLLQ